MQQRPSKYRAPLQCLFRYCVTGWNPFVFLEKAIFLNLRLSISLIFKSPLRQSSDLVTVMNIVYTNWPISVKLTTNRITNRSNHTFSLSVIKCSNLLFVRSFWAITDTFVFRYEVLKLRVVIFFQWRNSPNGPGPPHYRGSMVKLGRTPLDE
jgi:hypothetical protein